MYTFKFYDKDIHIPFSEDIFLIKPVITMGANQSWTISAQIMSDHPNIEFLKLLKYGLNVYKDGELISRCRLTEHKQGMDKLNSIFAEDKLAALNDSQCRPYEFAGSPEELFTWFLNNHNSQVGDEQKLLKGNITVTDPNDYIVRSWDKGDNTWSLMKNRLLDTLGGYFVVRYEDDGDYLDWIEDFDTYSNQKIKFGDNLLNLEKIIDATETYTACIPYGAEIVVNTYGEVSLDNPEWQADTYYTKSGENYTIISTESDFNTAVTAGTILYTITSTESTGERLTVKSVNDDKDYIINTTAQQLYGTIYAPTDLVTWDDVTRPENLLTKATNWLNNDGVMLEESTSLTAADLSAAGIADVNSFEMYQKVYADIQPLGINKSYLVTGMKINAGTSDVLQITVGDTKRTLSAQITSSNKQVGSIIERVEKIESDYATNEKVTNSITKELSTFSSQILQTSENITIGILAGYTTTDDLEKYKQEVENTFNINEQGFAFQFAQTEEKLTELGNTVTTQNSYIRLENGEIIIGQTGENASPITTVYTNAGMEIRFNGVTVAKYTDGVMEINNAYIGNQLAFWKQFAFRKGAYITDVGYNLNLVWIGG